MSSDFSWMEDPRLTSIPQEKIAFLQELFTESKQVSEKERMLYFTNLAKRAKQSKIQFTKEELKLLSTVIRSTQPQKSE